ncbi:hypothetical protein ACI65C_004777 [Semiaphis heraclei]
MKVKAKTTKSNPAHIFGDYVAKLNDKTQMPSENIVKRTLQNRKTKNNHFDSDEVVGFYLATIRMSRSAVAAAFRCRFRRLIAIASLSVISASRRSGSGCAVMSPARRHPRPSTSRHQ